MPKQFDGNIYWDVASIALGTLASLDVDVVALKQDGSRPKGFRFMKTEYFISVKGLAGDEPILVGIGGPAMDAAEIEEAIEADPQGPDDRAASEQCQRPCWPLEMFMETPSGDGYTVAKGTVNLRWSFPESTGMNFWVYNPNAAALTTGATVVIVMKHYGVWLRD